MDGTLLANAGDAVPIPDLGRVHMPQSNEAHKPQLWEPVLLESMLCNRRGTTVRNPVHCSQRAALLTTTRESNEDPPQPKLNKFKKFLKEGLIKEDWMNRSHHWGSDTFPCVPTRTGTMIRCPEDAQAHCFKPN